MRELQGTAERGHGLVEKSGGSFGVNGHGERSGPTHARRSRRRLRDAKDTTRFIASFSSSIIKLPSSTIQTGQRHNIESDGHDDVDLGVW